jgi:hypothetical protein
MMRLCVEYVLVSNMRSAPRECPIALIDHYFAEVRFEANVVMTFENPGAIKAVIRNGTGVAMAFGEWARES